MAKPKPRRHEAAAASTVPEPRPLATRLSVRDVAKRYGVSEETVRRWIRQRLIPYELTGAMTVRELPGA